VRAEGDLVVGVRFGTPAEGVRPDGTRAEGVLEEGTLADGVLAEGVVAEGVLVLGVRAEGVRAEGTRSDGRKVDGLLLVGVLAEGVRVLVLLPWTLGVPRRVVVSPVCTRSVGRLGELGWATPALGVPCALPASVRVELRPGAATRGAFEAPPVASGLAALLVPPVSTPG
jgi:hypothetical protein